MRKRVVGLALGITGLAACASVADFSSDDPGLEAAPGAFDGRFIAVSDASMAATAYADGRLEPFDGMQDQAALFEAGRPVAAFEVSNSVMSWPQIIDVSDDGRFAFVVETRGNLDPAQAAVADPFADFPEGKWLTVVEIGEQSLRAVSRTRIRGSNPQSVEALGRRPWIAIATETDDAELELVRLSVDGTPVETVAVDLDPVYLAGDSERRVRTVSASPDGNRLAANLANRRIQFYRVNWSAEGTPVAVVKDGEPIAFDGRIATGRWTPDGRYFLTSDVRAGDGAWTMLTLPEGFIHVVAPPDETGKARLVASEPAGTFPEGFEISADGTRVAAIAMERTYLPQMPFLSVWPKRRQYSVTLMSLDPASGALKALDRIREAGVLPEDVLFDKTGQNLAVAVFHRRMGPDRRRGFIDFYRITPEDRLESQGVTQVVMRGPHDLAILP